MEFHNFYEWPIVAYTTTTTTVKPDCQILLKIIKLNLLLSNFVVT